MRVAHLDREVQRLYGIATRVEMTFSFVDCNQEDLPTIQDVRMCPPYIYESDPFTGSGEPIVTCPPHE